MLYKHMPQCCIQTVVVVEKRSKLAGCQCGRTSRANLELTLFSSRRQRVRGLASINLFYCSFKLDHPLFKLLNNLLCVFSSAESVLKDNLELHRPTFSDAQSWSRTLAHRFLSQSKKTNLTPSSRYCAFTAVPLGLEVIFNISYTTSKQ